MSDKIEHKCVLCNDLLPSKEELQLHFRQHANKQIDGKGRPGKVKSQKSLPKKEPNIPNGKKEPTIACDVCGEVFTNNTVAIQHKFKKHPEHTNKFYCPFCGAQFPMKSLVEKHINTHNNDTTPKASIICEDCGVVFYNRGAKEYHHKSAHKRVMRLCQPIATPPPSKKIKMNNAGDIQSVYYCHLCGSEYVVKFNLQKHLEKAHTEEERGATPSGLIRCTTCDGLFYNQKAYTTHTIHHKPNDLYVETEQQRLQTVSRVDQDFDIRRVLPLAEKYLPTFKFKPKSTKSSSTMPKLKSKPDLDDDLSPPSSPGSSDSDEPLIKLTQDAKKTYKH